MALTDEQKDIARKIIQNRDNYQIQTLGGYAGTGKTTLIGVIAQRLKNFAICAYTGKAANVLRKKGMQGQTIHSLIYQATKDINGDTIWSRVWKDEITRCFDGFIVDEASMVSKEIAEDLAYFGLPIIYVGDHGQLEPIGTKFNLMQNPMYRLETVHRNAGEIAHFAEHLRMGNPARTFKAEKQVQIVKERAIKDRHLANTDQIICAFNKTRVKLNERVRNELKIQYSYVAKGERVMCLRNNRPLGLFNGMQGVVTRIRPDDHFDFVSDGVLYQNVLYDPDQFGREQNDFEFSQKPNPFDYAYAITCHKSQGDEWGNVIVYEERCEHWEHKRWAYTAASRAKRGLIYIPVEEYIPSYLK